MKLKLIALAAMLAATGAAHAKVADSNDNTLTSGSGDLFANVWSVSQNASFTVDLGITLDQFRNGNTNADGIKLVWDLRAGSFSDQSAVASGISLTQTLNYGNIYSLFATPSVAGAADLKFDLKAMDGTPTFAPGAGLNRFLSTSSANSITATNGQVFGMDNWDVIVNASNNDATNSTHGADLNVAGANMFDSGDASNVNVKAGGEQWVGAVSFNSAGSASDALNFYFLTNSSGVAAPQATVSKFAGQWTLGDGVLTYATAPVPEAETYAMMLAGLGLVGFMVSRRRKLA